MTSQPLLDQEWHSPFPSPVLDPNPESGSCQCSFALPPPVIREPSTKGKKKDVAYLYAHFSRDPEKPGCYWYNGEEVTHKHVQVRLLCVWWGEGRDRHHMVNIPEHLI